MNNINAPLRKPASIQPVSVSLEQRLQYLATNVERLMSVRRRLTCIAGDLTGEGPPESKGEASPPASSLSGKIGEQLSYAAANLDEIEILVSRLENALFEPKAMATVAGRG